MKTQRRHPGVLEFIHDILLARARLAQAKSNLAMAGARAQGAKSRGGRNRTAIRFARKQTRHAEIEFNRARDILAKMEKRYFSAVQEAKKTLHTQVAARKAVASKLLPVQAKRSLSAVHLIREKKPVIVFRGIPLASSANASLHKKQPPIKALRPNHSS